VGETRCLRISVIIFTLYQIKETEMAGARNRHATVEKYIQILIGRSEGKNPLRRSRRRLENFIRMDLRGTECDVVDYIHLTEDRD
jgi:hypothetical protein